MKVFSKYVAELRRLALATQSGPANDVNTFAEIDAALDGGAGRALRRLVDLHDLRSSGAFFSGSRLSRRAARLIAPSLDRHSVILDPACGAGDLLLACAGALAKPHSKTRTLASWSKQLRGRDLRSSFVEAARIRLILLAMRQQSAPRPFDGSRYFPELKVGCGMRDKEAIATATHIVLNPPFTLAEAPRYCQWASGSVNSAAVFLERCLRHASPGTQVVAILPDVLRSGGRYRAWRRAIQQKSLIDHIGLGDQFDPYTDVNVFLVRLKVRSAPRLSLSAQSGWGTPRRHRGQTVKDSFDISVGPVVDYRDEHRGAWRPFIRAKTLVPWTTMRDIRTQRRFEGRLVESPFVAVKRTSRPGDAHRAVATVVSMAEPVAVENHVLVLRPKDGLVRTCRRLVDLLAEEATSVHLNQRIRCRHLTVGALGELPWTHQ